MTARKKGKQPRRQRRPLAKGTSSAPSTPAVIPAEPIPEDGLTPLRRLFVLEFLQDENATRAYLRSHPDCSNVRTAATEGWKLLRKPEVADAVTRARQAQYKRLHVSADEALANISRNARADLGDCYHPVTGQLLAFHLWPDSVRKAVKSFKTKADGSLEVTLYDGQRANELMAQAGGKLKNVVTLEFDHAAYLGAAPPKRPDQEEA